MSYRYKKHPHRNVQRIHASRSKKARSIDEGLKAPIAKNVEQWISQPNRYDLPNVDTPKRRASQ